MLITVVVASYNRLAHLQRCLAAIAAQRHQDWECLVCDDGSTDGTHDFVRSLSERDARFRLSLGRRFGLPAGPRNRGIAEARAEWVAFVDDDDLWHPEKLSRQVEASRHPGVDAVSTRLVMFEDGAPPEWETSLPELTTVTLSLDGIVRQSAPFPSTPTNMIRRDRLLAVRGFAEHGAYRALEDYDLWCRLRMLPRFDWRLIEGPPLAAARDAGSDSISSWRRVPAPDFVRQRWAILEIFTRTLAAGFASDAAGRKDLLAHAAELATGAAERSRLLGWREAAAVGARISARLSAARGRGLEAMVRRFRAAAAGAVSPAGHEPPNDAVRQLVARVEENVEAALSGRGRNPEPIPVAPDGAWSSLPNAGSGSAADAAGTTARA